MPVEMFNRHYTHIIEKTTGIVAKNLRNLLDLRLNEKAICEIIENYRNH